ncbi:hypothetical protein PABG_05627 [Paracoccidioides brasiliensis Pb03]|nr:hypothetical protein PABG_05627 [Paracoccidioides brasiliensis Pb03]
MVAHQPSSPLDASSPTEGNVRKRVCKACDRCRLKKSKCDGANPCGRCKTDNAICVFGERKKAHDKVYPKGYVEMLEQQQAQLVTGLQALYKLTLEGEGWPGGPLKKSGNGHPLTHDILERLGALKQEGHSIDEPFEDDIQLVQKRLIANGAGLMQRQDSSDGSESERSPTFPARPSPFEAPYSLNHNPFPPTPPSPNIFPVRAHQIQEHMLDVMAPQQQQHQFALQQEQQRQQEQNKELFRNHFHQKTLSHNQRFQGQQAEMQRQQQQQQRQQRQQRQQQTPHDSQQRLPQPPAPNPPIFFNSSGVQPSMNPNLFQQQQPWPQGGGLDDAMDITSLNVPPMSFEALQQAQAFCRPVALAGGLNSCLPMQHDWTEDADFKAFLNPTATMI